MTPWYELALKEVGTLEGPDTADNPKVVAYYRDAGFPDVKHDEVPWCAAFVGAMLKRAGLKPSGSLMARSYLKWGTKLSSPVQGCVTVIERGTGPFGHVFFFVSPGLGLGGNQSDSVSIAPYNQSRVLGYRWPTPMEKKVMVEATVTEVVVPTKNPWYSTINWVQLGGILTSLAVFFKVPLTAEHVAGIIVSIQAGVALFTWVRHTWYETSILASAAKNLPLA
jgi:uncharacterized protein (TIGR02594 family)